MSFGFNTDIQVGGQVFHVQTEDRGPSHPVIDTAVYQNGRVLHRRSSNYAEFAASPSASPEELSRRVEQQHRQVIEDLRAGTLAAEVAATTVLARPDEAICVQLVNPHSWLTAGNVSLEVQVLRRADHRPKAGARVEAAIEGALQESVHCGTSDAQGRVQLRFPLPPLGKGELALVLVARDGGAEDRLLFTMRSKPSAPPAGATPGSRGEKQ